jgi:hypothetical protein
LPKGEFVPLGQTVNQKCYLQVLSVWDTGIIILGQDHSLANASLHCDNALSHSAFHQVVLGEKTHSGLRPSRFLTRSSSE